VPLFIFLRPARTARALPFHLSQVAPALSGGALALHQGTLICLDLLLTFPPLSLLGGPARSRLLQQFSFQTSCPSFLSTLECACPFCPSQTRQQRHLQASFFQTSFISFLYTLECVCPFLCMQRLMSLRMSTRSRGRPYSLTFLTSSHSSPLLNNSLLSLSTFIVQHSSGDSENCCRIVQHRLVFCMQFLHTRLMALFQCCPHLLSLDRVCLMRVSRFILKPKCFFLLPRFTFLLFYPPSFLSQMKSFNYLLLKR
jgi:hypothetical protein